MIEVKKLKLEDAWIKLKSAKTFEEHTGTLIDMFCDNLITKKKLKEELNKAEEKYPKTN